MRDIERKSWFGPNEEKEAYERALEEGEQNEEVLKKLLVRRTMTDVRRLIQLQEDRDSVQSLSRAGALAEDMLADFKLAENELELELYAVQAEAETFREGWGAEIIQDAARLSKIEDELLARKKRQEASKERQERDEEKETHAQQLYEQEKQRLLKELLEEEADNGAGTSATTGAKLKKRAPKHK